ncbi:MAG: hypothetical protein R2741_04345 [Methanolobus sp.]
MQEKRYPKGYFIALGIIMGLPLGIPIGIILGIIAIGPLIGVALGLGAGVLFEKEYNPNPLQLSPEEQAHRKKIMMALGSIFLLEMLMFLALLMLTDSM